MSLVYRHCQPCRKGTPPLTIETAHKLLSELKDWHLVEVNQAIEKKFSFKNFSQSLEFVNKTAEIAEAENHHPDISFGWGYATVRLTTHAAGGLTENDFIVAARIDAL